MGKALERDLDEMMGWPIEVDSFVNSPFSLDLVPAFRAHVEHILNQDNLCLLGDSKWNRRYGFGDTSVAPNEFDLQRHTCSVGEHVDDVRVGVYFGLFAVGNIACESFKERRIYDNRLELRYSDQYGYRQRKRLNVGQIVVFNPRKKHELIFYGSYTTLALFSVTKIPKRKTLKSTDQQSQ